VRSPGSDSGSAGNGALPRRDEVSIVFYLCSILSRSGRSHRPRFGSTELNLT
jgi:hypothetical protein